MLAIVKDAGGQHRVGAADLYALDQMLQRANAAGGDHRHWNGVADGPGQLQVESDLGAVTWPAAPIYVDVRVKDDEWLTAIGGGAGLDVLGRDGLLVW